MPMRRPRDGDPWIRLRVVVALLLIVAAFATKPLLTGGDEPHYAAMATSIAFDGDLRLENQYEEIATSNSTAAGKRFSGKVLERHLIEKPFGPRFSHPIGLPLLAAPVLVLGQRVLGVSYPDVLLALVSLSMCAGGLITGARLLATLARSDETGWVLAAAVFFCSPVWFYSRTFFTEPYVWSGIVVGAWCASRGHYWLSGAVLGLVVLIREPSLLLALPVIGGVALLSGPKAFVRIGLGMAPGCVAVVARNVFYNGGGPLDFPQPFQYGSIGAGLSGLLVDPSHGLLWSAPWIVLVPVGFAYLRGRTERVIAACGAVAFLLYLGLAACWVDWTGGSCFGPRLVVPAIPFLAPALLPLFTRRWSVAFRFFVIGLFSLGAGAEAVAVANPFRASWSPRITDLVTGSSSTIAIFTAGVVLSGWFLVRGMRSHRETGQRPSEETTSLA